MPWDAFVFVVFAFLASCFMHLCDNTGDDCGAVCIASLDLLMAADVLSVNQLVMVAMLFPVPVSRVSFKIVAHVTYLLVNALLYYGFPEPEDYQMIIWGCIAFVVVLAFHLYFRSTSRSGVGNVKHFVKAHVNVPAAVLFAVFAGGGLAMRVIGNDNIGLYTPLHSAWHVAGLDSLYFYFVIFDTGGLCVWTAMQYGYDIASMDDEDQCELDIRVLEGDMR